MRKFGSVAVWLALATPAFAEAPAKEKEVWITIGTDALGPARASFQEKGLTLPAPAMEKGGVAALRVRESQLEKLSEAMHDKLNRCAGFIAHESEQEARTAVEGSLSAQAIGTQAVTYTLNNGPSVNAMLSGVQELNIRNTINSLSTNWTTRRYNLQSGIDAANWLKSQWTTIANGRADVSVALFTHASTTSPQPSVIATIQGTTLPNEVVVIGGHLDSINGSGSSYPAPGADDDASGVASLTEVFRVAMATGYKPARTVKFMAYCRRGDWPQGLGGHRQLAQEQPGERGGRAPAGHDQLQGLHYDFAMVTDNTNAAQNSFVTSLISNYLPGLTYTNITCGYGCSDHASWTTAGFASSMPFEAPMNTSNPYIHTANDTLSATSGNANNSVKFAKLGAAFWASWPRAPPPATPRLRRAVAPVAPSTPPPSTRRSRRPSAPRWPRAVTRARCSTAVEAWGPR
jgi:leucyl aminopeptidase